MPILNSQNRRVKGLNEYLSEIDLPSMTVPRKKTRCSKRNCCISSWDEKLISRETARHFKMRFGTRASCSTPGVDLHHTEKRSFRFVRKGKRTKQYKFSDDCHRIRPESASRKFIQCNLKPFNISSARLEDEYPSDILLIKILFFLLKR